MSSGKGQQQQQQQQQHTLSCGPVVRCGHLRKCGSLISGLKPLKKKYFVLRGDTPGHPACLEYYDNKKKYENKQPPKRTITMRSCYNINRRTDTKHKHVIALYTKDECFSLILDNDKEVSEWLTAMLLLSDDVPDGEEPRPTYEHVWQVTLQKKGLGERKNIYGPYRLCLTDRVLSLIKLGVEDTTDRLEFPLTTIRRCGCMDRIFYMEVGRSAITGEGDYWMKAEDSNIAQNMHAAILNAMSSSSNKDRDRDNDMVPKPRMRSSSANEASKPISVLGGRRPTGHKLHGFSPLEERRGHEDECGPLRELQNVTASAPSQCCSQSQNCSSSTNTLTAVAGTRSLGTYAMGVNATSNRRRHSVASQPPTIITNKSQFIIVTTALTTTTTNNNNVTNAAPTTTTSSSTSSTTTTTSTTTINTINKINTTKSHHQRTLSLPLAAVVINQTQSSKRPVLRCPTARDRCDSLPSRARTISDGLTAPIILSHSRTVHLAPQLSTRPHSMYTRGLSYSPPISSMPISPASGACSTDSAGSSLSMDDGTDSMIEETTTARYGHSLTPDEPVILEENVDDYVPWSSSHVPLKYSPNFKSHSPSQQSSYVEMYSPCGSSPGRGYLPMSPATTVHSHSRTSSLVEEATLPDGYVPMAPVGDDGYVDMDPANNHDGHYNDEISQHGSSCSVTSGTPSTDHRFTEYSLDKVSSFLTPSDEAPARTTRAYSVGSRPEPINRHRKNRLDIAQQETNRVRAFSVGSRSKRPEFGRLANVITARLPVGSDNVVNTNKSNSAPLLSSSWGHNSALSITSERMEDLMEMDFTNRSNVIRTTLSSTPSSYSQSHSYSTATDTSSYVDMSPGQPHASNTPYVDMSGINKVNRNNNNNNTTANHNHNQVNATTNVTVVSHKPVLKALKPVVEAEGSYLRMNNTMDDWSRQDTSPKQQYVVSPMQEDYMQMNGPPGVMRTAPVDLPQPRKPPEGYVEMNFKARPNLEQNYINMTIGSGNNSTRNRRRPRQNNRKDKSQRSQPIAIQATNKSTKIPSFLPLNGSSTSESLASTPASPPHATPTGSNSTIFPFSLNSPQSPIKPFTLAADDNNTVTTMSMSPAALPSSTSDYSPDEDCDYAIMTRGSQSLTLTSTSSSLSSTTATTTTTTTTTTTATTTSSGCQSNVNNEIQTSDRSTSPLFTIGTANSTVLSQQQDTNSSTSSVASPSSPLSPLSKRLNDLSMTKKKVTCHTTSPITVISNTSSSSSLKDDEMNVTKLIANENTTTKSLKRERENDNKPSSPINRESNNSCKSSQIDLPQSPVTKKLSEFSVTKGKFIVATSPNTSPTPMIGLKALTPTPVKVTSKSLDDNSTSTIVTSTPAPSSMDSEGYEKLQPGASLLHYASLDLPESTNVPPVSPTPVQDGFRYAEIDFAKLKQI